MTEEDFKLLVSETLDWGRIQLKFHTEPADLYHVTADIKGDSWEECFLAAVAVLNAVKGKTAFIRIPPEADSQKDSMNNCWLHRGYVRFSFKNEPGEWNKMELEIEGTTEFRYLPLRAAR